MKRKRKKLKDTGLFEPDNITFWGKYWQDMPEFVQRDLTPLKSIIIHFKTKDDIENFSKLINQNITNKTKSLWFPKAKINRYINKMYVDES